MSWNKKGPDKMKIVIIKGSPHKKGSSNMLAEQFIVNELNIFFIETPYAA